MNVKVVCGQMGVYTVCVGIVAKYNVCLFVGMGIMVSV